MSVDTMEVKEVDSKPMPWQAKKLPKQIFRHYNREGLATEIEASTFLEEDGESRVEVEINGQIDIWGWENIQNGDFKGRNWKLRCTEPVVDESVASTDQNTPVSD